MGHLPDLNLTSAPSGLRVKEHFFCDLWVANKLDSPNAPQSPGSERNHAAGRSDTLIYTEISAILCRAAYTGAHERVLIEP